MNFFLYILGYLPEPAKPVPESSLPVPALRHEAAAQFPNMHHIHVYASFTIFITYQILVRQL